MATEVSKLDFQINIKLNLNTEKKKWRSKLVFRNKLIANIQQSKQKTNEISLGTINCRPE